MSKNEIDDAMFLVDLGDSDITDRAGSFIADATEELRSYIGVPKSMALPMILPIMSYAIGSKAHTYSGAMEELRVNLWSIVIGGSGISGKSTTLQLLKDMVLGKLEQKLVEEYKDAKTKYDLLGTEEKSKTEAPRMQRIYSGQGSTFAGMIKNLSLNSHGLLITYDEGAEFLRKMSRDKEIKASFTSLYAQKTYGKDLVGKEGTGEQIWINDPFVSLILISNPYWFHADAKNSDFTSGFLNRFSIYNMEGNIHRKPFANNKKHDFGRFQDVAVKIWEYLSGLDTKLTMELSEDSMQRYQEWFSGIQPDPYALEGVNEEYAAFQVRQEVAAIKYAMIIQLFDEFYEGKTEPSKEIRLKYMDIGIKVAEEGLSQTKKLLDYRKEVKNDQKMRDDEYMDLAKKVKNYLKKYGLDEENPLAISKLIRQVRGLNQTNIARVTELASMHFGVKSEQQEHKNNRVVTYYHYPSQVDGWDDDRNEPKESILL